MTTSNTTNLTLDINQACITASSVQWIIASLAYMVNAMLVLEFLTLSRYCDKPQYGISMQSTKLFICIL